MRPTRLENVASSVTLGKSLISPDYPKDRRVLDAEDGEKTGDNFIFSVTTTRVRERREVIASHCVHEASMNAIVKDEKRLVVKYTWKNCPNE